MTTAREVAELVVWPSLGISLVFSALIPGPVWTWYARRLR